MTLSDDQLFAAFNPEQAKRYRDEAGEVWGEERVQETERKLKSLSQQEWQAIQEEGRLVAQALASLIDRDASDAEVQIQIARHHAWIETFYPAPAEVYLGLAQMYVEHPEFRSYYDRFSPGLADFMQDAIRVYSEEHLS